MSAARKRSGPEIRSSRRRAWGLASVVVLALAFVAAGDGLSAAATDTPGAWRIERDPGGRSFRAVLPSDQTLSMSGDAVQPALLIVCREGSAGIWLDFGRPVHPALAPMRASIRLDQGRAIQATWNADADQRRAQMVETPFDAALRRTGSGTDELASQTALDLARALLDHDRLAVRTSTAYAGHVALSFELAGIRGALDRMADACGWSASPRADLR